jgi:aldehyde dehydrogenase
MSIVEKFVSMDYGPAPEDPAEAMGWLDGHNRRLGHFINGAWREPSAGQYFDTTDPSTGETLATVAQGGPDDVDAAVRAARQALGPWQGLTPHTRARYLYAMARQVQKHSRRLAVLETMDNGKPIRESRDLDIPLVARHFYYHAGWAQLLEHEFPGYTASGVVGQIIPWNFPILMAVWKLAPALAAGNCVVLKPAEQTPLCILVLMELIQDLLPPGVLNVVNGFGLEAGKPLASSSRIAKIAFTGETTTGRLIMQYASENIIPVTLELGGKSPNIFLADVLRENDDFVDKALEGFAMFALNQGEVCTCPSRALVQRSIYERFMEKAVKRVESIRQGDPFEMSTQIGAQASNDQFEKILSYIDIGKKEGAKVLTGGSANKLAGELAGGYYIKPTVFEGHNKMRIFQEEIFGPVVSVTTFDTPEQALEIANDTLYGLGAGVWTRDLNLAYRFGRGIKAGRVWTNCFHAYPAHAAFGGYKKSGMGRETHKMMLDHYQQTKNMLVSYSPKALGFF